MTGPTPTLIGPEALVGMCAALAGWLACGPVRRRGLATASTDDRTGPRGDTSLVENARARAVVCVSSCTVLGFVALAWAGVVVGAVGGVLLSRLLGRLESPGVVRERERLIRDLPVALDLMAACAHAGLPLARVLPQVARAVGGPVQRRLERIVARWDLGADPVREWQRLVDDPVLGDLGAAMVRAHRSGAPLADTLTRVAADARRVRRTQVLTAARSMAVSSAAPLAVCFLPAFLLVGVVPTVIGGFTQLL
jgi:pilus assembly protein TadC